MTKSEILQIAKPILFNTEMVRAIMDGRKTVTRRCVNPQPDEDMVHKLGYCVDGDKRDIGKFGFGTNKSGGRIAFARPRYRKNDYLYVRETWCRIGTLNGRLNKYVYKASDKYPFGEEFILHFRWHPSIHMPKEAARIFLKVTNVRVERLQDITDEGSKQEGIAAWTKDGKLYKYFCADSEGDAPNCKWRDCPTTPKDAMKILWDSTIKKQDLPLYGWNANPWVLVYEFERVEVEK